MNQRSIDMDWLLRQIDALELVYDAGDDAEFNRITARIREMIGRALLHG